MHRVARIRPLQRVRRRSPAALAATRPGSTDAGLQAALSRASAASMATALPALSIQYPCATQLQTQATAVPLDPPLFVRRYYSQLGEDQLLHESFFSGPAWNCRSTNQGEPRNQGQSDDRSCKRRPVFLELGANNGQDMSNTAFFERSLGWHGVLIEAVPQYCRPLTYSRCSDEKSNVIACGAICRNENNGSLEMTILGATTGALGMGTSSTHQAAWTRHFAGSRQYDADGTKHRVPCAPLGSILASARVSYVDLFSLDVEEQEAAVLQTLDLTAFSFGVLVVELSCPNDDAPDQKTPIVRRRDREARARLVAHGYKFALRHKLDEIWVNTSVAWAVRGAEHLSNASAHAPSPCAPKPSVSASRGRDSSDAALRRKQKPKPPPHAPRARVVHAAGQPRSVAHAAAEPRSSRLWGAPRG